MCHLASVTSSLRSICFEFGSFESPLSVPTVQRKVMISLIECRCLVRLAGCSLTSSSRCRVVRCSVSGWSVGGSKSSGSCCCCGWDDDEVDVRKCCLCSGRVLP